MVTPEAILTGHVEPVVCVCVTVSLGLVVSGAKRKPSFSLSSREFIGTTSTMYAKFHFYLMGIHFPTQLFPKAINVLYIGSYAFEEWTPTGRSRGVPWVPRNPLFVVLRACIAGLMCAHECSRKHSGQRNPPFQNPRSATGHL